MAVECIFSWCWLADLCAPGLWLALKRNQKLALRRMGIAVTLRKVRQLFFSSSLLTPGGLIKVGQYFANR